MKFRLEAFDVHEYLSYKGLLLAGMAAGLLLTAYSLMKGLWSATSIFPLAFAATLLAIMALFFMSLWASGNISDRKWLLGAISIVFLLIIVVPISFFSYTYWYDVVGKNNDWFAPDARRAVQGYYRFNRDVAKAVNTRTEAERDDFKDRPDVGAFAKRMNDVQDRFSAFAKSGGNDGQSIADALLKAANTNLGEAQKKQTKLNKDISDKTRAIEDQEIVISRITDRLDRLGFDGTFLVDSIKALNTALDYEYKDPGTAWIDPKSKIKYVGEPDFARMLLRDLDEKMPNLQVKKDSCGKLLTEAERAANQEPIKRKFGKGGGCTGELERLEQEIASLRTRAVTQDDALIQEMGVLDQLNAELTAMRSELGSLEKRIEKLQDRVDNPDAGQINLDRETKAFLLDPNEDSLNDIKVGCDALAEIADGIDALKQDGPINCSIARVSGEFSAFRARVEDLNRIHGSCLAGTNEDQIRQEASAIKVGAEADAIRKALLTALTGVQDKVFRPCVDDAESAGVAVSDIRSDADDYIANKGAQSPLAAATDRFFGLFDGTNTNQQIGLYILVVFFELMFFLLKIFWNANERRLRSLVDHSGRFSPGLSRIALKSIDPAPKGSGYVLKAKKIDKLKGDVGQMIRTAMEELRDLKLATRLPHGTGFFILDEGHGTLRRAARRHQEEDEGAPSTAEDVKAQNEPDRRGLSGSAGSDKKKDRREERVNPKYRGQKDKPEYADGLADRESKYDPQDEDSGYVPGKQSTVWKDSFKLPHQIKDLNLKSSN